MLLKYLAILLGMSAVVVLAGKKEPCPFAEAYAKSDLHEGEPCGGKKVAPCSSYDRLEDCPRKERKAFEKERKFRQRRAFEDEEDDDFYPEMMRERRLARDLYPEEDDEFVARKESKMMRKMKKDKKYKREQYQYEGDEEMDPEGFPSSVSPPCQRYMHDVNKLAKCERKQAEARGGERRVRGEMREGADYPSVCQQFAYDPYKLIKCVRKTNFWADFGKTPNAPDMEGDVHPECLPWAHDPYKLSKCEFKLRKFSGENMKKSAKGFY